MCEWPGGDHQRVILFLKMDPTTRDFRYNALTTFCPEIGNLSNLQNLYADHNQIRSVSPEIARLSNLQVRMPSRLRELCTGALDSDNRVFRRFCMACTPLASCLSWGGAQGYSHIWIGCRVRQCDFQAPGQQSDCVAAILGRSLQHPTHVCGATT